MPGLTQNPIAPKVLKAKADVVWECEMRVEAQSVAAQKVELLEKNAEGIEGLHSCIRDVTSVVLGKVKTSPESHPAATLHISALGAALFEPNARYRVRVEKLE